MKPSADRAAEITARLKERGISKAEAARRIGYFTEAGVSYVRRVLSGTAPSSKVLDRIEAAVLTPERAAA